MCSSFLFTYLSPPSEALSRSACVITGGLAEAVSLADALQKAAGALDVVRMWQKQLIRVLFVMTTKLKGLTSLPLHFPPSHIVHLKSPHKLSVSSTWVAQWWDSPSVVTPLMEPVWDVHTATFLPLIFSPRLPPLTARRRAGVPTSSSSPSSPGYPFSVRLDSFPLFMSNSRVVNIFRLISKIAPDRRRAECSYANRSNLTAATTRRLNHCPLTSAAVLIIRGPLPYRRNYFNKFFLQSTISNFIQPGAATVELVEFLKTFFHCFWCVKAASWSFCWGLAFTHLFWLRR